MTRLLWYRRSGKRTTEYAVRQAKAAYAAGKRTGRMGGMQCSINPAVADRIDAMSLQEFADYTWQFTFKLETWP